MRALQTVLTLLASVWIVVAQTNVEAFIAKESPIAKANMLANIGTNSYRYQGALAGVVVAAPSTNPDYRYVWTRDAALVFKAIIDQFTSGADTSLRSRIDDYVQSTPKFQALDTPSGSASSAQNLGEPKFNLDITAFTGSWGRPQRDGPPLRATALITYANWLISQGNQSYVTNTLWPIIKKDLDYTANFWNQSTFDLWEEVSSSSFFTTAVQHRALREGITLAKAIGQTSVVTGYSTQADNTLCFQQSYWNSAGYMTANTGGGRSGKDANTILTSIHTFDPAAGCDSATFQPCSDKALANLYTYVNAFRSIYTVNSGVASNAAVATGRYPEDTYYNGNPWYLATFAVAEQLYDALIVWKKQGSLTVTATSLNFFKQFSSSVTAGTYASSTATYSTLTTAIKTFADGFVAVAAKYTPSDGSLAEQYDRNKGSPLSANDLTWSYASALTAFGARAGVVPASWGASGLKVPSTCSTGGGDGSGSTVAVTFNVATTTTLGENIYITGSVDALKNWSPENALILSAANYPTWSITINIPANTKVEYKYIRKFNGAVTWESDPNRSINTSSGGALTQNDSWR
jgi:glucoamylase